MTLIRFEKNTNKNLLFIYLRHNKETNTDCYFMLEWDLSKMLKQRCTSRSSLITTRKAKCFVKTNC